MELGLKDRVVLVTGGSKGIGLACAQAFQSEGARVAIASRHEANLVSAADALARTGARPHTVVADCSDDTAAARMLDDVERALGPIDVLVASAGAARRMPADELTPAAWRAAMDAKYFAYVFPMHAAALRMAARGRGTVVAVIGAGGKVANPAHLAGGAANAALMLVTAGLANAYGPRGVRVVGVNPGLTLTERLRAGMEVDARTQGIAIDEALRRATARLPLGRIAEPREIADAVVFLASDRASYVTGAIVSMDGAVTPTVV